MPVSNSSSLVSWRDSSDSTRGTYDIIALCASTLLICVWSALHVDIPTNKTFWNVYVTRAGLLVVGTVMPELLVFAAFGQFLAARKLVVCARTNLPASDSASSPSWRVRVHLSRCTRSLFRRRSRGDDGPSTRTPDDEQKSACTRIPRRHRWTLTHGFYGAMGGFVFETAPGELFLPCASTRVSLGPEGLIYLMEHAPELMPDIPTAQIADRSKSGLLGAALLFFQIISFCVTCIARRSQHLPMSLLEVTTLAHSLCVLAAYALWWRKPFNISEPTLIAGDKARELCALLFMCTATSNDAPFRLFGYTCSAEMCFMNTITYSDGRAPPEGEHLAFSSVVPFMGFVPRPPIPFSRFDRFWPYARELRPWYKRAPAFASPYTPLLSRRDATRLTLARTALSSYPRPRIWTTGGDPPEPIHAEHHFSYAMDYMNPRDPCLSVTAVLISVLYGLPHLLGLSADFATPFERTCWRVATSTVVASAPLTVALGALWCACEAILKGRRSLLQRVCARACCALFSLFITLYVVASVLLVYVSLRQLFALPEGAFLQPGVSHYVPHFS